MAKHRYFLHLCALTEFYSAGYFHSLRPFCCLRLVRNKFFQVPSLSIQHHKHRQNILSMTTSELFTKTNLRIPTFKSHLSDWGRQNLMPRNPLDHTRIYLLPAKKMMKQNYPFMIKLHLAFVNQKVWAALDCV